MNRINTSTKPFPLSFLLVLFVLVTCTTNNSADEVSVTLITPSPDVATERPSPVPTEVESRDEDMAVSLVEAKVREAEGYDESVTIKVEQKMSIVALPGLALYQVTPQVLHGDYYRCAVYGEEIWCFEGVLQKVVRRFGLGSDPNQLSDEEWLALVAFLTYTNPLNDSDDLNAVMNRNIPDNRRAVISPPVINRPKPAGIEIAFFFEGGDDDFYFMSLNRMDVTITEDDEVTVQYREVWHFYNE